MRISHGMYRYAYESCTYLGWNDEGQGTEGSDHGSEWLLTVSIDSRCTKTMIYLHTFVTVCIRKSTRAGSGSQYPSQKLCWQQGNGQCRPFSCFFEICVSFTEIGRAKMLNTDTALLCYRPCSGTKSDPVRAEFRRVQSAPLPTRPQRRCRRFELQWQQA